MGASFSVTDVIPASADRIYQAWLDPTEHSAMTGGAATAEPRVGGQFSAWDGYITGRVLELEPGRRIVQAWRTNEFPDGAPDSRVEIVLEPIEGGTRIILHHTNVPDDQRSDYEQGWRDHYFQPMRSYFMSAARVPTGAPPADVDAGWVEEPARSDDVGRNNGVHLAAAEAEEEAHPVWEPVSHDDADEHELPTAGPAHKKKPAGAKPKAKAAAQAKKQAAPVKAAAKKPAKKPAVKAAAKGAAKKAATKKTAKKPAVKAAAKKAAKAKKPAAKKKGPAPKAKKKAAKKGRR